MNNFCLHASISILVSGDGAGWEFSHSSVYLNLCMDSDKEAEAGVA